MCRSCWLPLPGRAPCAAPAGLGGGVLAGRFPGLRGECGCLVEGLPACPGRVTPDVRLEWLTGGGKLAEDFGVLVFWPSWWRGSLGSRRSVAPSTVPVAVKAEPFRAL